MALISFSKSLAITTEIWDGCRGWATAAIASVLPAFIQARSLALVRMSYLPIIPPLIPGSPDGAYTPPTHTHIPSSVLLNYDSWHENPLKMTGEHDLPPTGVLSTSHKTVYSCLFHSSSHNLDRMDFVQIRFGGPPISSLLTPLAPSFSDPTLTFRTHTQTHLSLFCISNFGPDAFDN